MPTKKTFKALSAEALMTRRVVACRPQTDLAHVARLMWENDCGIVPVVDGEDRVVGVVTDRDVCMSAQFRGQVLGALTAGECMTQDVVTASPMDPAEALVRSMGAHGVRRLPVTDAEGRLLGLVAVSDLFRGLRSASPTARSGLEQALLEGLGALSEARSSEVLEPAAPVAADSGKALRRPAPAKPARKAKPAKKAKKRARS